jgi:hypothetical protein
MPESAWIPKSRSYAIQQSGVPMSDTMPR